MRALSRFWQRPPDDQVWGKAKWFECAMRTSAELWGLLRRFFTVSGPERRLGREEMEAEFLFRVVIHCKRTH